MKDAPETLAETGLRDEAIFQETIGKGALESIKRNENIAWVAKHSQNREKEDP